jgi:hypothetical protein
MAATMGHRTTFALPRLRALCFCLLLPLVAASGASACPLCYQAAQQMMTEGVRLDTAERVVLATRVSAGGPLQIVAVVKGADAMGDAVAEPVAEGGARLPTSAEPSLLIRQSGDTDWTSLGEISLQDADWLHRIVATLDVAGDRPRRRWPLTPSTADSLSYAGWRERVALVAPRLEDANPLVSRLAWGELARAPYAILDAARSRVDPASVEAWLGDPKLATRRAAYLTLLGFVGGAGDAVRLDQRLEAALAAHDATDLAAVIAADLELGGPRRVDWISAQIFADKKRTMPEIEAALLALNVLGEANNRVPRASVVAAYRDFIRLRPAMAGFVAPQLADWGSWEAAADYAALVKANPAMDPSSQFAIVNYLKRAAEAGVAR